MADPVELQSRLLEGELLRRINGVLDGMSYAELLEVLVGLGAATQEQLNELALGAGNLPAGGTTGQVAAKASNADNDVEWVDVSGAVATVNGATGAVVLDAADVGADAAGTAAAAVSTHSAATSSVHGIADTSTLYRAAGTDVAVADGGTGSSNAAGARANLAVVGTADTSVAGFGFVVDEDNMASNSATKVPTQQSVKAYIDNLIATKMTTLVTSQYVGYGDTLPVSGTEGDQFDLIDLA